MTGGEQDAVAVVAGGPDRPATRPGPSDGALSGRAGAQAGDGLLDLQLEHAGDELGGLAQEVVHAPAVTAVSKPRSSTVAPRT